MPEDMLMTQLHRFHRQLDPDVLAGYCDVVTYARFRQGTAAGKVTSSELFTTASESSLFGLATAPVGH